MFSSDRFPNILLPASFFLALAGCLLISYQKAAGNMPAQPAVQTQRNKTSGVYRAPQVLGTIRSSAITESSGLVASRNSPGLYWTHNDSGDGPFIYAIDTSGQLRGVWRVRGAEAFDWEDIAAGPGPVPGMNYLYIGDIGDNSASRKEIVIYRVPEPVITNSDLQSTKSKPRTTEVADAIRLRFPDGKHDTETLLVHPKTGILYVLNKVPLANPSVYEARPPFSLDGIITMKRLGELKVPSLFGGVLTGGDISPDGRRVALCDYFQGYELTLPDKSQNFDDIWQQRMEGFDLGKRKQGESIAYRLDGRAMLATSEGRSSPLIQVVRNN
jgi:hypothetical protein